VVAEGVELETNLLQVSQRNQESPGVLDEVFGTHRRALQDVELVPQHQDFGFKPSSRLETVAQHADEKEGNSEHPPIMF
jgi:hypothetical protein